MNRIRLREGSGIYFDAAGLGAELAKDSTFIRYGHCRVHAPWMRPGVAKALGFARCCGAGIFSVGATLAYRERMLVAWPLGALAVASVVAMFGTIGWEPPINLESLDERYARLSGFGGGYLNHIPDFDAGRDRANAEVAANLERLAEFEE